MEWTTIYSLIDTRLLIVVAVCWVIGYMLKQTPKVPDWSIIYVVSAAAIILSIILLGWSGETIIQGILSGAFAVYGHQFVKQSRQVNAND